MMYWRILRILAAVPRWMLPTPLNLKIDSLLAEESDTLIRDLAARVVSYDPTTTPRQHFATEVDIAIERGASLEDIEHMAPHLCPSDDNRHAPAWEMDRHRPADRDHNLSAHNPGTAGNGAETMMIEPPSPPQKGRRRSG